jgi:hypothetical protein
MEALFSTLLGLIGLILLTTVAIALMQRSFRKDGPRVSASMGDGLGNLIDVFDPGNARAQRDLKEQRNVGPVTPTPDPDPEDPIRLELGPDGSPARVTLRRPEPR